MSDEPITSDEVVETPPPSPVPPPERSGYPTSDSWGDEQGELTPEVADKALRLGSPGEEAPPAGALPTPIPDVLTVPELAPHEHKLSDEVEGNLAQLAAVSEREGMTLEATQGLVDLYYELDGQLGDLKVDQRDPDHQERTLAHLRRTWGSQYKENLANAQKAFKGLSPTTQRWLNETGAGDDASVLSILAAIGGGILKVSPAVAKREADNMRKNSPELLNSSHPDHHMAKLKYRLFRHVEGRSDREPSERASEARSEQTLRDHRKPPPEDSPRVKAESEAKQLMRSEAWADKRNPAHKATAARVAELFRIAYPEGS